MKTTTAIAFSATFVAAALAVVGVAATPAAPVDVAGQAIGPAVGTRIAMNTPLIDASGKPTTLKAVSGGRPMMLVLFRSAAWCPYCQVQLKGLGPVAAAAKAKNVRFAAISYDKPAVLGAFAAKHGLTYPLFSDTDSKFIDALRVRDPRYKPDSFAYGTPYPTTLVIDAKGVVKAKTVDTDYKLRPSTADMVAMMDRR